MKKFATAVRVAAAVLAVAAAVVCCLNGAWLGWAGWTVTAWLVASGV